MLEVEFTPAPRVLRGLDAIAAYLHVSRATVYRYIENYALPAMRLSCYITTTSLIDLWIITVWSHQRQTSKAEEGQEGHATSEQ
jgi:hypothetical protein